MVWRGSPPRGNLARSQVRGQRSKVTVKGAEALAPAIGSRALKAHFPRDSGVFIDDPGRGLAVWSEVRRAALESASQ